MGGDAFPNTERLSEAEYYRVCQVISTSLNNLEIEYIIPVEVSDKHEICKVRGKNKPYGDVDVIVAKNNIHDEKDVVNEVIKAVNGSCNEIMKNDSTYSFLTSERYQVDLKFCLPDNLQFLGAFKSNNDFGALLGHLLTPLQLKWSDSGLMIKLRRASVSGVGAVKSDLLLTRNIIQVCDFLGLPQYSLDGETRLSCRQIFDILTSSRVFYNNGYEEKYKIKERRKKRPVSDSFFTFLEEADLNKLMEVKNSKFCKDSITQTFNKYREQILSYDEYLFKIAQYFNQEEELHTKLQQMDSKLPQAELDPKFNHIILSAWYPQLSPNQVGKLLGKVKSKHSGAGTSGWSQWILDSRIEDIKLETEIIKQQIM